MKDLPSTKRPKPSAAVAVTQSQTDDAASASTSIPSAVETETPLSPGAVAAKSIMSPADARLQDVIEHATEHESSHNKKMKTYSQTNKAAARLDSDNVFSFLRDATVDVGAQSPSFQVANLTQLSKD